MGGENIEKDAKTKVWTENVLSVFGAETPAANVAGLAWTGPQSTTVTHTNLVIVTRDHISKFNLHRKQNNEHTKRFYVYSS